MGKISEALRANLREVAQSDARSLRDESLQVAAGPYLIPWRRPLLKGTFSVEFSQDNSPLES